MSSHFDQRQFSSSRVFTPGALLALALLDASAVPALVVLWSTTWPGRGGLFGAVLCSAMIWWAFARSRKALRAPERFVGHSRWLLKAACFGVLLQIVARFLA